MSLGPQAISSWLKRKIHDDQTTVRNTNERGYRGHVPDEARGWFTVSVRLSSNITILKISGRDPFKFQG